MGAETLYLLKETGKDSFRVSQSHIIHGYTFVRELPPKMLEERNYTSVEIVSILSEQLADIYKIVFNPKKKLYAGVLGEIIKEFEEKGFIKKTPEMLVLKKV